MCFSSSDDPKNADLFEDSTHKYVLYNGKKKNINGCIVGIFVIIVQFALYAVCASQVADDLDSDKFFIPVKVRFGKPCNAKDDVPAKLVCPPELPNLKYVALAAIMLSLFLMKDIVGPLRGFKQIGGCWSKIWCIILFVETTFAALVAVMFAVGASEPYDAISNCIGVLFIHDLDEKAFEAFKMIQDGNTKAEDTDDTDEKQEPEGCCHCLGRFAKTSFLFFVIFGILAFSLIAAVAIREQQRTQLIEYYGEGYYENQFSNGYYDAYDSNYYEWDGSYNANFGNDGIANIDTTTTTTSPGDTTTTTTSPGFTTTP
jgi:hypothetical protein